MTRRSIHAYKADQVSKAQIDTIMKCAILAPSANNKQPWEVRIVQNPDMLKKLNDIKSVFYNAPTFIFVARDVNNPTSASDCGMLSQNILLSAHAMGLGTCVIGSIVPVINDPKAKEVKDALQFSEGYEIMYGIALGYGNETPQVKDRDATKVKYID
ncbi:MAG: nitroreductase [Dysgonomonas sp.]